jgi:hypothetical protein
MCLGSTVNPLTIEQIRAATSLAHDSGMTSVHQKDGNYSDSFLGNVEATSRAANQATDLSSTGREIIIAGMG